MAPLEARTGSLELLRGVPSLRALSDVDLGRIASLLGERLVKAGEVLVEEGTAGNESFLVVDGTATVLAAGEPIASVGTGDFVGELAILTDAPRCATVRAETPMHLLVLDKATLSSLIDPIAEALLGTLARRVRPAHDVPPVRPGGREIGASVAVRSRYDGRWVDGFEVVDVDLTGATPQLQVRRRSDGAVLPVLFAAEDVRSA
jgi:CRP-like cAMP-binding protein